MNYTKLLFLMSIVPLYVREATHFSTTITLVLTSILCLYPLLQSSIAQIPETAYLKLIDYWNMLSLSVTLTNFFTLILWEILAQKGSVTKLKQIKDLMRVAIPLCTMLGVLGYCMFVSMKYWCLISAMCWCAIYFCKDSFKSYVTHLSLNTKFN